MQRQVSRKHSPAETQTRLKVSGQRGQSTRASNPGAGVTISNCTLQRTNRGRAPEWKQPASASGRGSTACPRHAETRRPIAGRGGRRQPRRSGWPAGWCSVVEGGLVPRVVLRRRVLDALRERLGLRRGAGPRDRQRHALSLKCMGLWFVRR